MLILSSSMSIVCMSVSISLCDVLLDKANGFCLSLTDVRLVVGLMLVSSLNLNDFEGPLVDDGLFEFVYFD